MDLAPKTKADAPGVDPIAAVRAAGKELPRFPSRPNLQHSLGDPPPPEDYVVVLPTPKNEAGKLYDSSGKIVGDAEPKEEPPSGCGTPQPGTPCETAADRPTPD